MIDMVTQILLGFCITICAPFFFYAAWRVWELWQSRRERETQARVAAIEAELDEKSRAMRERMFEIAEALHAEGHEARKSMIRASFIASGKLPGAPR